MKFNTAVDFTFHFTNAITPGAPKGVITSNKVKKSCLDIEVTHFYQL